MKPQVLAKIKDRFVKVSKISSSREMAQFILAEYYLQRDLGSIKSNGEISVSIISKAFNLNLKEETVIEINKLLFMNNLLPEGINELLIETFYQKTMELTKRK